MPTSSDTVTALRGLVERAASAPSRGSLAPLGHPGADAALGGGLARGALHEVFAAEALDGACATGFVAALAVLAADGRAIAWVREDPCASDAGEPFAAGLAEVGLEPARLVLVRAGDAVGALRAAWDALRCEGLGAAVLEPWREPGALDLVAGRRLAHAAAASGVTALALRVGARPAPSPAATRWVVGPGPPTGGDRRGGWGRPLFDAALTRNRAGPAGRWSMEWSPDALAFR